MIQFYQTISTAMIQFYQPKTIAMIQFYQPISTAMIQFYQPISIAMIQFYQPISIAMIQFYQTISTAMIQFYQPKTIAMIQFYQPISIAMIQFYQIMSISLTKETNNTQSIFIKLAALVQSIKKKFNHKKFPANLSIFFHLSNLELAILLFFNILPCRNKISRCLFAFKIKEKPERRILSSGECYNEFFAIIESFYQTSS